MTDSKNSSAKSKLPRISNQQLRILGCYVLFQLLNLLNLVIAVLVGACLLAFVLALRGQPINNLLPWFLLIALPIWVAASFWTYSALIRYGVLTTKKDPVREIPPTTPKIVAPKEREPVARPVPANDDDGLLQNLAPLRRLFSL